MSSGLVPVGGVVSLWGWLKFHAHGFVAIMSGIAEMRGVMNAWRPTRVGHVSEVAPLPAEQVEFERCTLARLRADCIDSLFHSAADQLDGMDRLLLSRPVTLSEYTRLESELTLRIEDELKRRTFYQTYPDRAYVFEADYMLGEAVASLFPDMDHDLGEAFKCCACERHDASVYHIMRAMEHALLALARSIGIEHRPTWDAYLKPIDEGLKNVDGRDPAQRERERFLGESSALLRSVKISYRNATARVGSRCSPEQAKNILDSVSAFIGFLAENWKS